MLPVRALFVDIGGVLLNDGWGSSIRARAAAQFGLDLEALNARHAQVFELLELGKLTLEQYLRLVAFQEPRPYSVENFRQFIFAQSEPQLGMLDMIRSIKAVHGLRVIALSNDSRELATFRINAFMLGAFVDAFVVSSFVHLRKPDPDVYRLALDLAQVRPQESLYLEDRALFVEVAAGLGIRSLWHRNEQQTRGALAECGLHTEP